jgi:KAP-like P-loop domain-containing protein
MLNDEGRPTGELQLLLDTPAPSERLALGFAEIASGIATMIRNSVPRFTIGIFGPWGSGKTTLMEAIESELVRNDTDTVTVRFNAWRYEREPHLIIPLVDELRQAFFDWSRSERLVEADKKFGASIGRKFGSILKAVTNSLSLQVGVPYVGQLTVEGAALLEGLAEQGHENNGDEPSGGSIYFRAFRAIRAVVDEVAAHSKRLVVFVDDLDRCLPERSVETLEALKLFFDLEGVVFVVGLDVDVIERTVEERYRRHSTTQNLGADGPEASVNSESINVSGSEYVKKIFQIPFSLPRIREEDAKELLRTMCADLSSQQQKLTTDRISRHLWYMIGPKAINARDVKRFVNAYVIQRSIDRYASDDQILSLLVLQFRRDWDGILGSMLSDGDRVIDALSDGGNGGQDLAIHYPHIRNNREFMKYIGDVGRALLEVREVQETLARSSSSVSSHGARYGNGFPILAEIRSLCDRFETKERANPGEVQPDQVLGENQKRLLGELENELRRFQVILEDAGRLDRQVLTQDLSVIGGQISDLQHAPTDLDRQVGQLRAMILTLEADFQAAWRASRFDV